VLKEEDGVLEEMIETNLYSTYYLTRHLHPLILESSQAHIFNVCSIASIIAYPNGGSYSISKFAQLGFSKVLREELKKSGVKVTAVIPGATRSYSWRNADFPDDRLMQAEDIAEAVMSALSMTPSACVEEIIIRPQLGDLPS
jgi:short-subunit dehydrogenase